MKFAQEQEIEPGNFFILNGVMVYVAELNDPPRAQRQAQREAQGSSSTTAWRGRTSCGPLATELYKDPNGRRLSDPNVGPLFGDGPTTETVAAPRERVTGPDLRGEEPLGASRDREARRPAIQDRLHDRIARRSRPRREGRSNVLDGANPSREDV